MFHIISLNVLRAFHYVKYDRHNIAFSTFCSQSICGVYILQKALTNIGCYLSLFFKVRRLHIFYHDWSQLLFFGIIEINSLFYYSYGNILVVNRRNKLDVICIKFFPLERKFTRFPIAVYKQMHNILFLFHIQVCVTSCIAIIIRISTCITSRLDYSI